LPYVPIALRLRRMSMLIRTYHYFSNTKQASFIGGGTHPFYEVLFITAGMAQLDMMNEVFEAGDQGLFLIPAHVPHHLNKKSNEFEYGYLELEIEVESSDLMMTYPSVSDAILWNRLQKKQLITP